MAEIVETTVKRGAVLKSPRDRALHGNRLNDVAAVAKIADPAAATAEDAATKVNEVIDAAK